MKDTERITRSNRAAEFLKSPFWTDNLGPWLEGEKSRLMQDYISLPNTDKFHSKREDLKARFTACSMVEGILNVWKNEKELVQRSKELEKANEAMTGGK